MWESNGGGGRGCPLSLRRRFSHALLLCSSMRRVRRSSHASTSCSRPAHASPRMHRLAHTHEKRRRAPWTWRSTACCRAALLSIPRASSCARRRRRCGARDSRNGAPSVSPTAVTATVTARKRKFSLFRTLSTLEFAFFLVLLKLTENARWKAPVW